MREETCGKGNLSVPKPIVVSISGVRVLRKYVARPFLRANEWVWKRLPGSLRTLPPVPSYGAFLHSLVRLRAQRTQFHGTFFFRNRPQLELIRSLVARAPENSTLRIAVVGCSNGAEVYSILWTTRSARPDMKFEVQAIDISAEVLESAREGVYSLRDNPLVAAPIFERLTESEMTTLFDREKQGDEVCIKPWIAEGINWQVGNAADPRLIERLGGQDMVIANNFLCHLAPAEAEGCLRNLQYLVRPGGYLFVSGVDLDVRTKVAVDLGWTPVPDLLEEIHNGDPVMRRDWPWKYWGLEPFDPKRPDWQTRYAAVFQTVPNGRSRQASRSLHQSMSVILPGKAQA